MFVRHWTLLVGVFAVASACGDGADPDAADEGGGPDSDSDTDFASDTSEACDADGDGATAISCGGEDCDDGDPTTRPGSVDGWETTTIDEEFGGFTSIAVDSDGAAHISYAPEDDADDLGAVDVRYATDASGSWAIEVADPGGQADFYTAMAIDPAGFVHVVYADDRGELRHLTREEGGWTREVLRTEDLGWGWPSLRIEESGVLHVGYALGQAPPEGGVFEWSVLHLVNAGDGWTTESLQPDDDVGNAFGLALGADGRVDFLYSDWTHADNRYATNASGAWETTSIGEGRLDLVCPEIDASGTVHAAMLYDWVPSYATNAGGTWTIEPIGERSYMPSLGLALDAAGAAHVCYQSGSDPGDLHYATNASAKWTDEIVELGDTATGRWCSIGVAADGVVHIAYDDSTHLSLRHARGRRADGIDQDCNGADG